MMLIRYLRLWRQFVITALVRETEYRLNFLIGVGEGIAQLLLVLLSFHLLYRFTDSVAGWTQAEVLVLVGIYRVVEGLLNLQISPNMEEIPEYVRSGEMDFMLLRPVNSQFLTSLRKLTLPEAINVLIGVAVTIYAGHLAGVRWDARHVLLASMFMLIGLVLLYAIWLLLVTLSFWLVQVENIYVLFYNGFETARYPVSFFKDSIRTLLTFVFPVAFATTFPTQALLGRIHICWVLVGIAMAALALLGTHLFWNYAVRHYSSASS